MKISKLNFIILLLLFIIHSNAISMTKQNYQHMGLQSQGNQINQQHQLKKETTKADPKLTALAKSKPSLRCINALNRSLGYSDKGLSRSMGGFRYKCSKIKISPRKESQFIITAECKNSSGKKQKITKVLKKRQKQC